MTALTMASTGQPLPDWLRAMLIVVGTAAVVGGLAYALKGKRRAASPTRLTVGLSLAFAGYHALAEGLPTSWILLRVPTDRLWVAGLLCVAAVGASVLADRMERAGSDSDRDRGS